MHVEVTIRFLVRLADGDDSSAYADVEDFADELQSSYSDIIRDVHILDVEEV